MMKIVGICPADLCSPLELFCWPSESADAPLVLSCRGVEGGFESDSNNMYREMCFKFASFLICALEQAKTVLTVLPLKGETMISNRMGCVVVTYYA